MDDFTDLDIPTDSEDCDYNQFTSSSFLDNLEGHHNSREEEIPDIDVDQESDGDVIQDEESPVIADWSISLSNVPKAVKITEFGHTYIYGRLKDPDGSPTNKFHGFFKNGSLNGSTWKSLPGVLSDRYVVVSLEKFINNVIKPNFENIVEYSISNNEPWKLAWLGIVENSTDYIIDYIDTERLSTKLKIVTNMERIRINSLESKLGFIVTNTYNGTNKLKISPIVKNKVSIEGGTIEFIDYFTFCNFTQVISHSSRSSNIENDLITIKENIGEHISILKEFTDVRSISLDISRCFRKSGRNIFQSISDGESQDKNLFDVLIAASIAMDKKYSIIEYLAMRSKVELFLERVF